METCILSISCRADAAKRRRQSIKVEGEYGKITSTTSPWIGQREKRISCPRFPLGRLFYIYFLIREKPLSTGGRLVLPARKLARGAR